VRPEAAHGFEEDGNAAGDGVLGQSVKAFRGAGKLVGGRTASLDDARVAIKTAGVGPGPEFGGEVDLSLVPGEAPEAVGRVVGREVTVERPEAARPNDEVEAEGGGATSGQARVEDNVVADRKLEHVQAQSAGEVEVG
jgi:hypothetical protein